MKIIRDYLECKIENSISEDLILLEWAMKKQINLMNEQLRIIKNNKDSDELNRLETIGNTSGKIMMNL